MESASVSTYTQQGVWRPRGADARERKTLRLHRRQCSGNQNSSSLTASVVEVKLDTGGKPSEDASLPIRASLGRVQLSISGIIVLQKERQHVTKAQITILPRMWLIITCKQEKPISIFLILVFALICMYLLGVLSYSVSEMAGFESYLSESRCSSLACVMMALGMLERGHRGSSLLKL